MTSGAGDPPPIEIWAVSDGRAGIEAQALGLAEAVARLTPARVTVKRIGWRAGLGRLPWRLIPLAALKSDIRPGRRSAWPDLWIATGRASLPLSTRIRAWSGGRTFVVQTQHPRAPLDLFDLVIPPEHDEVGGPNVYPILGAPSRLTPQRLSSEAARFAAVLDPLPRPRIAVIVGGKSKAHDLPAADARRLAEEIAAAVRAAGGSVMVSFTRRTPPAARAAMEPILRDLPGVVWDETGENPYFAFLAAADAVLVTEDSTNLATDAAATGKPVHVLPMQGRSAKLERFHAALRAHGASQPFIGRLDGLSYAPLAETDRAAAEIVRRLRRRQTSA